MEENKNENVSETSIPAEEQKVSFILKRMSEICTYELYNKRIRYVVINPVLFTNVTLIGIDEKDDLYVTNQKDVDPFLLWILETATMNYIQNEKESPITFGNIFDGFQICVQPDVNKVLENLKFEFNHENHVVFQSITIWDALESLTQLDFSFENYIKSDAIEKYTNVMKESDPNFIIASSYLSQAFNSQIIEVLNITDIKLGESTEGINISSKNLVLPWRVSTKDLSFLSMTATIDEIKEFHKATIEYLESYNINYEFVEIIEDGDIRNIKIIVTPSDGEDIKINQKEANEKNVRYDLFLNGLAENIDTFRGKKNVN